jgi:hypothetical protein
MQKGVPPVHPPLTGGPPLPSPAPPNPLRESTTRSRILCGKTPHFARKTSTLAPQIEHWGALHASSAPVRRSTSRRTDVLAAGPASPLLGFLRGGHGGAHDLLVRVLRERNRASEGGRPATEALRRRQPCAFLRSRWASAVARAVRHRPAPLLARCVGPNYSLKMSSGMLRLTAPVHPIPKLIVAPSPSLL